MATFEILDGFASVRTNQRVQRHGRTVLLTLLGITVALVATGLATRDAVSPVPSWWS